ncbi:hypothetical protein O181_104483 [Austropuccinia psidii MF-1]|uniref:Uncharacterized protein n=1 Tax=Austropuccinia psidii MF-1 TaxID=1389203 RepID=A0A9Q3PK20_9BASI|nr:hypothetical protein [Austropuccinia psidii MF-1]
MVHKKNGSNYSAQPDGCGQGIGKTKSRSAKSSSRKTHLEDARVAPHSPRSVPTYFDVNSEPELIHDNIYRAELFSSGRNRNISMPIQKLVQRSQRRGVGNMPKPSAGGHELLLTHQELSGSGEDHRALETLEPIVLQRQEERVGKTPDLETEAPVASTSSKPAPEMSEDKPKGPQKKQRGPKNHKSKGEGKGIWHTPYPQGYRILKLEPSAVDSVFDFARTLMEFTAQE